MADHTPTRTDEIKAIHREYKFFYQVLGGSLLVAIGVLIGAIAFSSDLDRSAYFINLYTSLLSILVTVFVIDFLNRRRDEQRDLRQLQQQLIRDARSTSNETAKNAIHQLNEHGWLIGVTGLLKGVTLDRAELQEAYLANANLEKTHLIGANLERAFLPAANLREAVLHGANLRGATLDMANLQLAWLVDTNMERIHMRDADLQSANLAHANLQEANLIEANLEGANLYQVNLERAFLMRTNLSGTQLSRANLQDAILFEANLKGANLLGSQLERSKFGRGWLAVSMDETTILPDGSHWTPDTDLTQFGCIIE